MGLEQIESKDYVAMVVRMDSADRVNMDTERMLKTVLALRIDPDDVVFTGDRENDEESAYAAGVRLMPVDAVTL